MKVQMLVDTATPMNGYVHKGDVVDVEDVVAERWVDHKIAVFANSEPEEIVKAEPDESKKSSVPKGKKKRK